MAEREKERVHHDTQELRPRGIPYVDRNTGEDRTFNKVILPKGTTIAGQDVSYFEFSPLFVNPSKYKGENFRDIPLLANERSGYARTPSTPRGIPLSARTANP